MSALPLPPVRVPYPHIVLDEDGRPFIEATSVFVSRIFSWRRQGTAVETLLRRYPQIGPARLFTALAFAYDNLDLVTADLIRERERTVREGGLLTTNVPFSIELHARNGRKGRLFAAETPPSDLNLGTIFSERFMDTDDKEREPYLKKLFLQAGGLRAWAVHEPRDSWTDLHRVFVRPEGSGPNEPRTFVFMLLGPASLQAAIESEKYVVEGFSMQFIEEPLTPKSLLAAFLAWTMRCGFDSGPRRTETFIEGEDR